jgi:hypothetical protein
MRMAGEKAAACDNRFTAAQVLHRKQHRYPGPGRQRVPTECAAASITCSNSAAGRRLGEVVPAPVSRRMFYLNHLYKVVLLLALSAFEGDGREWMAMKPILVTGRPGS